MKKNNQISTCSTLKNKTKDQVKKIMGFSKYHSDFDIWAYDIIKNIFFKREVLLFFNETEVVDIVITDYLLGNKIREYIY